MVVSVYDSWRCIYCTEAVSVRIQGDTRGSVENIMQGVLGGAEQLVAMEREEAEALGWRQIRDFQRGAPVPAEELDRLEGFGAHISALLRERGAKRPDRRALQVCPVHRAEILRRLAG